MARGENEAFLEHVGEGRPETLPKNERGEGGRFDTSRARAGRAHALDILNDPEYRDNLLKRMRAGEAGAIEVWIWRIGYGDPQKDESEREAEKQRFLVMREAAKEFLSRFPHEANVIDAHVQGATRVLPRPQLPPPSDEGDGAA